MRIIRIEACVHVPNVKFKLVLCQNDTKAGFKRPTQTLNVRVEGRHSTHRQNLNIP